MIKKYKTRHLAPRKPAHLLRIFSLITGVIMLASVTLFVCLYSPTLAYLTDAQKKSANAQAGAVKVSAPNLTFLPVDPLKTEPVINGSHLTVWDPGDINTIQWEIDNLGNKSVDLRYTVNIYWNEGPGMAVTDNEPAGSPLWAEAPYVYLYPATMSDAEITADMNSGNPNRFIAMDGSDAAYTNTAGAARYGSLYLFTGNTIDGVGQNAETGDATIPDATGDIQEFKLALSPNTPAGYMNRTLNFSLSVEGKQHRNTTDSDWSLIETQAAR